MRKLLAVLCLFGVVAVADGNRSATAAWALTGAVPTAATSGGLSLNEVQGFRVSVCAESGQTLAGAGALNAYYVNHNTNLAQRNPGLDKSVSVTATSCAGAACRCQVFPDDENTNPALGGQVFFVPNAVTVSGGTTVTVRIEGYVKKGGI